ncbi:hypothetical protein IC006_0427 [Sulfuracidifex tepidarius]|uniref:Uncharacterized protein n=1 Tax=Sulfuracidifex tepidarius TaxID=1294262 RepID=A0A510E098_9CREN|nr:hypothetical protein IC006_0427 [Sulfuracidifex tepidarius]BBG25892.1 hypothetical protein IC007_0397 [Sulfuracidifex tepidarius]
MNIILKSRKKISNYIFKVFATFLFNKKDTFVLFDEEKGIISWES